MKANDMKYFDSMQIAAVEAAKAALLSENRQLEPARDRRQASNYDVALRSLGKKSEDRAVLEAFCPQ